MIRGVLFDMDGVLFDTERLSIECRRLVAREMGYELSDDMVHNVCGTTHAASKAYLEAVWGEGFVYETFNEAVRPHVYAALERDGVPEKPGVHELLDFLRAQGIPAAVASSSRQATVRRHLRSAGIEQYFAALVCGDEIEHSKPAPDIFLAAAAALGLPAAECLALEDSPNGLRAAADAGCITVMVPDLIAPTPELEALCAAVLDTLAQVPAFIQEYNRTARPPSV